ncbi:MAG TPA: pirin family protein, partial [Bacteroidales bacterium]|nr:pirin family protein [Bacteroidales bacterium]
KGNKETISENELQVMSAGKGIHHSEYNASVTEDANFLQLWIFPRVLNIEPAYEKRWFDPSLQEGRFQMLVSPDGREGSLAIAQQAFLYRGKFSRASFAEYSLKLDGNGMVVFVINGSIRLGVQILHNRDAAEISSADRISFEVLEDATQILTIETPM